MPNQPNQDNILNKKIVGITWGVVLTLCTVFGGGTVAMVHVYLGIDRKLTKLTVVLEGSAEAQKIHRQEEDKKDEQFAARLKDVENKLMPQAVYSR